MEDEIKTFLQDILNSIQEIESFFANQKKEFAIFQNDRMLKRAVERNIEIIGEATSRILKIDSSCQMQNTRKIIATRNRIAHSYEKVSDDILWSIVIIHLPKLKIEVENLLK